MASWASPHKRKLRAGRECVGRYTTCVRSNGYTTLTYRIVQEALHLGLRFTMCVDMKVRRREGTPAAFGAFARQDHSIPALLVRSRTAGSKRERSEECHGVEEVSRADTKRNKTLTEGSDSLRSQLRVFPSTHHSRGGGAAWSKDCPAITLMKRETGGGSAS